MKITLNYNQRINFNTSDWVVFAFYIPLFVAYHFIAASRPIFYFMPFIAFVYIYFLYFLKENIWTIPINKNQIFILILYLLSCAFSIFITPNTQQIFWKNVIRDLIITSGPLLLFSLKELKFRHYHIVWVFIFSIICYIIWIDFDVNWNLMSSVLYSNYDFQHEYHFGTIACLFILYFFYKKDYKFLALAIFFMLLVNKRANLLGIFPAMITYYFFFDLLKIQKNRILTILLFAVYYITFYLIATNIEGVTISFLEFIGKKDMNPDHFLTGRLILVRDLIIQIEKRDWMIYFFGNGIGQTEFYLWKTIFNEVYYFYEKPFLTHNDFLKLHFDVGLIGVIIYFFIMYYLYCYSNVGYMMFFSFIPLFLIDNTLIFSFNIITACIMARVDEDSKPFNLLQYLKFKWHEK
ncbi:MAG: O-antigen ligase domain-containing protein [Cytophagales bacterium]|nr:MAG: O-antigen ligase domain-containing protein [Cytophagales bacterium]